MATTNTKLTKVLEYLIKNDEEKARELLHQVFIEKARAIHEELMSMDEEIEEEEMATEEMDETIGGSGDMGEDLTDEIETLDDEIEAEETMALEDADEELEISMGDDESTSEDEPATDMADDPMMGDDSEESSFDSVEDKMHDLESALEALKAEFEKLESKEEGENETDDESGDESGDENGEDKEQMETWDLDEEFDELAESLDLEVVEKHLEKSQKTAKDVGAASSGMSTGNNVKSPLPKSQSTRMGAGPVETGKGSTHNGYNLETAPKSADLGLGDNRRKKSTDGGQKVSKEGNSSALINKSTSDGFGAINNTSPLSKGGQNLK